MNYEVISVKIDPITKKKAKVAAEELGLSLSAVIKGFLNQFIKTKTITFSAREEIPNMQLQSILKKSEENYKKNNSSPVFKTGEDAVAWLEKQGV